MKIKKEKYLILLLLIIILPLLSLPLISSLEINFKKENYSPYETLQAEIIGNFFSLNEGNILIYKEDKIHPEPVIKGLTKQEYKYYFYAVLPKEEGNYSLKIQDTRYIDSGELKEKPIIKNFTIKRTNQTILSINPGFILASKDFEIKIKSVFGNKNIAAKIEETGETKNIFLIDSMENTLSFSISGIKSQKASLKIDEYEIPVFITRKLNESEETAKLGFVPSFVSGILDSGKDYFLKIFLENSGNKNITNIKLLNNFNATLQPEIIESLSSGNYTYFRVLIIKPKNNISGEIKATFENITINLPVLFQVTSDKTQVDVQQAGIIEPIPVESLSCTGIGQICTENQKCEGEIIPSNEGPCCKGSCNEIKKTSYTWVIGIVLIIILIILILFVLKRAKQKQKQKTAEEVLKEREKIFKERMMNRGPEVRHRLDTV